MWRRITDGCARAGLSLREVARRAGMSDTALTSSKSNGSVPAGDTLVAVAQVLGTTAEFLMLGTEGSGGAPDERLDRTLLAFLHETSASGLTRWVLDAPGAKTPTLGEAIAAIELLRNEPRLSKSNGEPIDGWDDFFQAMRKGARATPARRSPAKARAAEVASAGPGFARELTPDISAKPRR